MENLRKLWLLDAHGKPLDERLRTVFSHLLPKFRRQFRSFQDEAEIQNLGEEAVRRVQEKERQSGQELENPRGYAWKALDSVGKSAKRRSEMQVQSRTVASPAGGPDVISQLRAWDRSIEKAEQAILLHQFEAFMTPEEVWMFRRKAKGFSHAQIAKARGCSVNAVDQKMSRLIRKIRALAGVKE
jgi:DNA-directed RNA polymerase specialized sigma24 family protein